MRDCTKNLLLSLPLPLKRELVRLRELLFFIQSSAKEKKEYGAFKTGNRQKQKKNILIYHTSGMSFGGTEKNLQIIANNLCDDYNIFFMYATQGKNSREAFMNKAVNLIPFTYTSREQNYPYFIHGMSLHPKQIIADKNIDLIITASSGYPEYPINTVKDTPVIMINIFGSPNLQSNIVKTIFISKTVRDFSAKYIGDTKNGHTLFIPIVPPPEGVQSEAKAIRNKFNFKDTDFVFGRIGRNSDDIFDEIGIRAFQKIAQENPRAKYLIMSPPPILEKIVKEEHIPNVYFLPPSSSERDIWAFHYAVDSLAHFRYDGETFGLNIAESLYAGNPVISHASKIWNAHLDYLHEEFSRIASVGDIDEYAEHMKEFIKLKAGAPKQWQKMKASAAQFAKDNFSEKVYIQEVKKIVQSV